MIRVACGLTTGEGENGDVELGLLDENDQVFATVQLHKKDVAQFAASILSINGDEELAQILSNLIFLRHERACHDT